MEGCLKARSSTGLGGLWENGGKFDHVVRTQWGVVGWEEEDGGKVRQAEGETLMKGIVVPIPSSGELSGDQIQPPDITHLTQQIPKPSILVRRLRDGE